MYWILDPGLYALMPAPNERDTLKLKENYDTNDIVEEEECVAPKLCALTLSQKIAHWLKGGEGVQA
jgi:hypothetical protein